MPTLDTLVTFDVAPGFHQWTVEMTRADAERLAETVATTSDPDHTVTFCNECPNAAFMDCPHQPPIQVIAIGNLRLRPLHEAI